MANITVSGIEESQKMFERLKKAAPGMLKMAVYDGARVTADELKKAILALPVDTPRWLKDGDRYNVFVQQDKEDLANSLGIDQISSDSSGARTVIGFAGYGRHKTKKYRNGLPMQMIARSIESGSSVREPRPFVRPTAFEVKREAQKEMDSRIRESIRQITKG